MEAALLRQTRGGETARAQLEQAAAGVLELREKVRRWLVVVVVVLLVLLLVVALVVVWCWCCCSCRLCSASPSLQVGQVGTASAHFHATTDELTRDLRGMDGAKRNLVTTITALRRCALLCWCWC